MSSQMRVIGSTALLVVKILIVVAFMKSGASVFIYQNF